MTEQVFDFSELDLLGLVVSVDTTRVVVDVTNAEAVTRIGVGGLVAIEGATKHEFLIGVTERVTRSMQEGLVQSDDIYEDEVGVSASPSDKVVVYLIGTFRTFDGDKENTFKRGADSFPQIDRNCFHIKAENLHRFMNILGSDIPENERLVLGTFVNDSKAIAIANGDKLFQRHAAILGSTGSGKSWTVARILELAAGLKHSNLIVLDMHGEYAPLCDGPDAFAQRFKIAGSGDLEQPDDDIVFFPYWMLNRDEMLSMILDRSDQAAPNQAARFTHHVRALKEKTLTDEKQGSIAATFTVDSPIPYRLDELVSELDADNKRKGVGKTGNPVKGEWEGQLTRFLSRLQTKIEDRRYGFMFQPADETNAYGWLATLAKRLLSSPSGDKGIKIVDFSEVPPDVLPVVAGVMARFLYDVQFWLDPEKRTPFSIVCDEAHLYLPVKEGADAVERQALGAFERIAKEGRKYGVSIVAVSQRPSDVSRTILSQCNNFIALRLTNDSDQNVIKRLMPDSLVGLVTQLPLLDVGEAIVLGDAVLLPSRVKLEKPSIEPSSGTRDFWQEWSSLEPAEEAIAKGVESMRGQTRQQ